MTLMRAAPTDGSSALGPGLADHAYVPNSSPSYNLRPPSLPNQWPQDSTTPLSSGQSDGPDSSYTPSPLPTDDSRPANPWDQRQQDVSSPPGQGQTLHLRVELVTVRQLSSSKLVEPVATRWLSSTRPMPDRPHSGVELVTARQFLSSKLVEPRRAR